MRQGGFCYICRRPIELAIDEVDVDHIIALARNGPDDEANWGLVHARCNRSKGKRDLQLMRYIYEFRGHVEKYTSLEARDFTFGHALEEFYPQRQEVLAKCDGDKIQICYLGEEGISQKLEFPILTDERDTSIKSFIGIVPFQCIFHDSTINPRSIIDLEPMIEEFYNGNPQLLPSLARLEFPEPEGEGKILLFDGQHKTAAQLYVRSKNLFVRGFINSDINKLKQTNFRAHTSLAQIHFPQLISDKVGHDLFKIEFDRYLSQANWNEGSERGFLKSENISDESDEYSSYLRNFLKYRVLIGEDGERHKILEYVETVSARSKRYPLSYDTLTKAFLNEFLFLGAAEDALQTSQKYRELERENLKKLMEVFTNEILANKYDFKKGIHKLEENLRDDPDSIRNDHLTAYRICRASAMLVWIREFKKALSTLLKTRDTYFRNDWAEKRTLWADISNQEMEVIRKRLQAVYRHSIWAQKTNAEVLSAIASTKQKDWKEILLDGRLPGRTERCFQPLCDHTIFGSAIGP